MRYITYLLDGQSTVGAVDASDTVHNASAALGVSDLVAAIERAEELASWAASLEAGTGIALTELALLAPIPTPHRNIFCIGKNYADHVGEVKAAGADPDVKEAPPAFPIVFTKPASAVTATGMPILAHTNLTSELDYEGELAVIIGVGGRDIAAADAGAHIWGYTIINDVSARDRQRDHKQFFLGKSLDTFCPMGPFAVTADIVDPDGAGRPQLSVQTLVNGETRQNGSTANLIFDIPFIIETLSAGMALEPGDIIATGTPGGVGAGFTPPRYLSVGDTVEISISHLGTLVNTVAE